MRNILSIILFFVVLCGYGQPERAEYRVIPLPQKIEEGRGELVVVRSDLDRMVKSVVGGKATKAIER
ncbi:MAG: hypothetical protein J6N73_03565, partial [Prevotella sp.]|nr:hypothetical protein [Prevotella sp.]